MNKQSTSTVPIVTKLNYTHGALFALPGLLAGVVVWIAIWETGFIASLAAYGMAWATLWLYQKGAGGLDKKSLYIVLPYIFAGIVLSIFGGVVADGLRYAVGHYDDFKAAGMVSTFFSSRFWDFVRLNFTQSDFWQSYTPTILWSLAFSGLGVYRTVKSLLVTHAISHPSAEAKKPL
jgi:hypothetical protein